MIVKLDDDIFFNDNVIYYHSTEECILCGLRHLPMSFRPLKAEIPGNSSVVEYASPNGKKQHGNFQKKKLAFLSPNTRTKFKNLPNHPRYYEALFTSDEENKLDNNQFNCFAVEDSSPVFSRTCSSTTIINEICSQVLYSVLSARFNLGHRGRAAGGMKIHLITLGY